MCSSDLEVHMVNPAYETAKAVTIMLKENSLKTDKLDGGNYEFYVSDDPEKFRRIGGNILKKEIRTIEKVDIEKL